MANQRSGSVVLADIRERAESSEREMNAAIIGVVQNFAAIENQMCMIFSTLLSGAWVPAAALIFYTPANTETRFEMVNRVFSQLSFSGDAARVSDHWKSFVARLARGRKSRNNIVHGQPLWVQHPKGGMHMRHSPLVTDRRRFGPMMDSKQQIGLSAHDVGAIAQTLECLVEDAGAFHAIITSLKKDDDQTWRETLRSLEARHSKVGGR